MSEIFIENKEVVVPGQLLAKGMDYIPGAGAYREGDEIYANRVGLISINGRALKLIPLSGPYIPKRDDLVICQISDIFMSGWRVNMFTSNSSMLPLKDATNSFVSKGSDLSRILAIGEFLAAKVTGVTTQKLVDLSLKGPGLRKLTGGQIVKYSPTKFPRLIGKGGSMVSLIKDMTGCFIIVGQNGRVWVSGEPAREVIAVKAIHMIEKLAHTSGLTDKVKAFLEAETKQKYDDVLAKKEERRNERNAQQDNGAAHSDDGDYDDDDDYEDDK